MKIAQECKGISRHNLNKKQQIKKFGRGKEKKSKGVKRKDIKIGKDELDKVEGLNMSIFTVSVE